SELMNNLGNKINSLQENIDDWNNEIAVIESDEKMDGDKKAKKIDKINKKIDDAKKRQGQLEQSINDIVELGFDDNVYAFSSSNRGNGLHGVREGSDGKIYIEGSNDNLRVHEIRHVAQALASGNM